MTGGQRGTVIFDLDGTLVDSAPDLADSLDAVLEEQGLKPLGLEHGRSFIGHGIPNLVRRGLLTRDPTLSEAVIARATDRFMRIYTQNLSRKTRPYPGALDAILELRRAGWRLAVCTNKLEASARGLLADLKLISAFSVVAGPDTFGAAKPDPRHLLGCLPAETPENYPALLVGDSEVDLAAARAAGIPAILVSWGYGDAAALEGKADATVTHFNEVVAAVERLSPARTTPV
ncbi:phosphoglycolate phosphatase [Ovoidimarina sediminis]|uniref:phosphoglycolate phosphatase n=1 Tax=Ovoidimarina sediminis TaxID=3079856 RepID=UPI0029081174|nr:phosphoglycolate phosphatase [Rhodophyticola sp. MJ-SS7]MDU8946424.1 phosphoglycolate phosphatase [Rhodophyticola sp. MJ-SS7]